MADDGMLLNFSVGEDLGANVRRFKGGAWRDRMRAKRGSKSVLQKGTGANSTEPGSHPEFQNRIQPLKDQNDEFLDSRPSKRQRTNGSHANLQLNDHSSQEANTRPQNARPSARSREVISSLFSYNPTPTTQTSKSDEQQTNTEPTQPSNAPLIDGIDTFTSLGLSHTISAHLLTKMDLKNPTAIQKAAISQMLKDDSDAFIQSQTGSGKTLAYLLPIVQRIMAMSEKAKENNATARDPALHRDSGLFAIIMAPTRELCKQISVVLERLLGCAHYVVAGTVIGGEKKKSEKARLRKGINILVATPGRLVDHLDNTKVLDVSTVRWLVLDEGDRLMDLGFEEDISKIIKTLDQKKHGRRHGLPEKRTNVLCSATLKMNVQKLGEISLKDAILIKGDSDQTEEESTTLADGKESTFLAPAQLKQSFMVVPAKLRLVTLTALLRRNFARKGSVMKAIVFLSCADSVEFHYRVLSQARRSGETRDGDVANHTDVADDNPETKTGVRAPPIEHESQTTAPLLSATDTSAPLNLYKIHGSLPQPVRSSIIKSFAASNASPSLLLATDVAARGLDLPNLDLVIEYDPAFSAEDHLHRIGRTARLGRDGRAVIFLLPGKEEGYVEVLRNSYKVTDTGATSPSGSGSVTHTDSQEILRHTFSKPVLFSASSSSNTFDPTPRGQSEWEANTTNFQLSVERWILESPSNKELAKKAFQSHIRAYATHIASERKWFDIKELHLGHLAKAFGLRDPPPARMNVVGQGRGGSTGKNAVKQRRVVTIVNGASGEKGDRKNKAATEIDRTVDENDAAKKMREKVRNRKMMMGAGADEFNIA